MFRVVVLLNNGEIKSQNFLTKEEGEDYALKLHEKFGSKRIDILDKITKKRERIKL